jgi:hypothetical protein
MAAPPGPVTRGVFWSAVFDEVNENPAHDLALLKIRKHAPKADERFPVRQLVHPAEPPQYGSWSSMSPAKSTGAVVAKPSIPCPPSQ